MFSTPWTSRIRLKVSKNVFKRYLVDTMHDFFYYIENTSHQSVNCKTYV